MKKIICDKKLSQFSLQNLAPKIPTKLCDIRIGKVIYIPSQITNLINKN